MRGPAADYIPDCQHTPNLTHITALAGSPRKRSHLALAAVSVTEPAMHDAQSSALDVPIEPTNLPASHPMHADDAVEPVTAT